MRWFRELASLMVALGSIAVVGTVEAAGVVAGGVE
jgi:hypothetical protein